MRYNNSRREYLNLDRSRNQKNTDIEIYNCGGFALNTFNWYLPYAGSFREREAHLLEEAREIFDENFSCRELEEYIDKIILIEDIDFMLKEFEGRLRIWDNKELQTGERLIAYKVSSDIFLTKDREIKHIDWDFHYRFTDNEETWYEKMGRGIIKKCENATEEDIDDFWETGAWTYTSPTVFLVLKLDQE